MKTLKTFFIVALTVILFACGGEKKCDDVATIEKVSAILEQNCKGCYSNPNTIRLLGVNQETKSIACQLNVDVHMYGFNGFDSFKYTVESTTDGEDLVTVYKK